ncbi:MAG: carbohydrate binding family 9 domain-containing protein, partial [Mameliella sp.]|nr:carbohydrate binding family 9 domain-containing protein [Phaeodactylibacter sp.]
MFIAIYAWGQEKVLTASRTYEKITIDGRDLEKQWSHADVATHFLELNPTEGKPPRFPTEVRVLYDNNNLYILGYCYDEHPDSILTQLGERDDDLNADLFTVSFDTYNQMIDAFTFSVSASGVQSDSRISDPSFNAVWESAVQVVDDGWIVEIEIPYYAIRFPKGKDQVWRVNFEREIRRSRTELQWALVPKEVETELNYWGLLKGLNDIKDPLRLSLSPYVSSFGEFSNGQSTLGYGAGADLKLGLNESFTLDMTLLPDFSQVVSDNIIKNLGAFEVAFEEQRPFFQEGVELFNLGDLFYSRRIGGVPSLYGQAFSDLDSMEVGIDNPANAKLVNVAKVSGRNQNGLGIGVMNAITGATNAIIENTATDETRVVETNPLVNYSIVSLDQNLRNNSSVYFINLNTIRAGDFIDANVSAAGFNLISKNSTYAVSGNVNISQRDTSLADNLFKSNPGDGISYALSIAKIKGNFKYALSSESKSPNYNPNDLGLNFTTNIRTHALSLQYNKYNPFWILNRSFNRLTFSLDQDYTTGEILKRRYSGRFSYVFPSFNALIINVSSQIGDGIDLFESRVAGQPFIIPEFYYNGIGIST